MTFQIAFLGLITFYKVTPDSGLVLLPDGIGDPDIPNHYGRLYVRSSDIRPGSTWRAIDDFVIEKEHVHVYALDSVKRIRIDAIEKINSSDTIDASAHTTKMPSLQKLDVDFQVNPDLAMTQIAFGRGQLVAYVLSASAVSVLDVENDKDVTLECQPIGEKLVTAPNAEIVVANMSNFRDFDRKDQTSHFNLYRRLHPDNTRPLPDPQLGQLPDVTNRSAHPVVKHIHDQITTKTPRAGCSGTVYTG